MKKQTAVALYWAVSLALFTVTFEPFPAMVIYFVVAAGNFYNANRLVKKHFSDGKVRAN
jgi:hypothetical protein